MIKEYEQLQASNILYKPSKKLVLNKTFFFDSITFFEQEHKMLNNLPGKGFTYK